MKTPYWFLHKSFVAFLLWPISWAYYFAGRLVFLIRKMFAYKSDRPIICIGNILSGGVGKTPVVRAIAEQFDLPIVMRGYKSSLQTEGIGDEALMLSRGGLQVHTGNRKSNIILLDKQKNRGPIILDDGLQNPTIKKDISILVFDERIGWGNGFLLPAGPLREPKKAAEKADAIIVIRNKKPKKNFVLPKNVPVFYCESRTISPFDEDQKLVAFAGIGYPRKFFLGLKNVVGKKAFPDHYQYTNRDINKLIKYARRKNAKLITTEKDWIRLPQEAKNKIKYGRLDITIDKKFFDWLKEKF